MVFLELAVGLVEHGEGNETDCDEEHKTEEGIDLFDEVVAGCGLQDPFF